MSYLYLYLIYYCSIFGIFYMTCIICNFFVITFFSKKIFWEEKYIVFYNIQKYFTLDMKISIFINYSRNMCWSCFCITLLNSLKNLENIMNLLNHLCFYIPWICCRGYNFLSICVINWIKCTWTWMTCCCKSFTRRKNGNKKGGKKTKRYINLCAIHQCLQIGCKLRWVRPSKP